jgi:tRNA A37 N6-isopentenylltransferase MiaA
MLAWKIWQKYPYSWEQKVYVCEYYQWRNKQSYDSRKKPTRNNSIFAMDSSVVILEMPNTQPLRLNYQDRFDSMLEKRLSPDVSG